MASWEDTKQEAQSVNNIAENFYRQDAYGSTRNVGIDTLIHDRQYHDRILSYEIAVSAYEPTAEDWKDYERYLNESSRDYPDPEPQDPEM